MILFIQFETQVCWVLLINYEGCCLTCARAYSCVQH